jgi:hypothetical protein
LIRRKTKTFSSTLRKAIDLNEDARFQYKLDLSHLIALENRDLIDWKNKYDTVKINDDIHPLDVLYNKKIYL